MPELPVNQPLEVRIEEPPGALDALATAEGPQGAAEVAARWPACLAAWATLGEVSLAAGRPVEAYAYFRVGYHRGLDRLRGAGWRGQGGVPWAHEGNRGFLRALRGLGAAAEAIGEAGEARRCESFMAQLAPGALG